MTIKEKMLLEGKAWVLEKLNLDKHYFGRLSGMHTPNILWIGSSDSLVPVRELTNTEPGEILVYQNMASQVRPDDISFMATLEDALEVSKVEYIIICGYSHCGGIRDVLLGADDRPHVKAWLAGLRELYERNADELDDLEFEKKEKRLCELNIKEQILNLSRLEVVQRAWERGNEPILLGWYFDLDNGSIKEIFSMESNYKLHQVASVQ
jgi:carbonic anhydrase